MFPIPKYLKIAKSVIQIEIIKPFFEEASKSEKVNSNKVKSRTKNIKITKPLSGSVK